VIPAPKITVFPGKTLAGLSVQMTFAENRTYALWQRFMPVRKKLPRTSDELYSLEVFPFGYFEAFDISIPFQNWAAMEWDSSPLPEDWSLLQVPKGLYAVFLYKGLPSDAAPFYDEIFTLWLPSSDFVVDDRPHFALMDARYEKDSADSEETIWIPIKQKSDDENRKAVRLFNEVAQRYDAKFSPMTIYDATYDHFLSRIPPDGKVIDVACGPGNMTRYFLSKRPDLDIFGIDLAPDMIALAKRNNPAARFEVMDMRNLSDIHELFDGICCGFALPYLPDTGIRIFFEDTFRMLNPGGIAYFSAIEGQDEVRIDTSGDGRHKLSVHTHSEKTLTAWLKHAGFTDLDWHRVVYAASHGEETHLIVIARKP